MINKIHERALSLPSQTNDIPFNELLSINNDVSIHNRNTNTFNISLGHIFDIQRMEGREGQVKNGQNSCGSGWLQVG